MDKMAGTPDEDALARMGGMVMPRFSGPPMQFCLAHCDVDEMVQPSPEECEGYALYLRLPELSHFQRTRLWPGWANECLVRPALHSLEMVFRMISSVLCDQRAYIDRDEWLRRLEALANSQLELLSLICEGDCNAPTTKQQQSTSSSPRGGGQLGSWQKSGGSGRAAASVRCSQESLLPRMATWKRAQGLVSRLHFAIEGHMLRVPFTLGLGEPNLSGKPVLEYDKICVPADVYACLQAAPGCPEDHALATAHQIMEAWLVVAQGLVKSVEERVMSSDTVGAAKKCWILERVWKLFTSTMDMLQVMDPDDFMKLKQNLVIKSCGAVGGRKRAPSSGAAFCLRSTMLRTVTKACKELRSLVPKVVGVKVDPTGGPRVQEAIIELFNSHGQSQRTKGYPYGRPYVYHAGTIHLLQALQAIEVAIRQFYFTYRHLVITVMGSGEYTGSIQTESSGADALLQLYSDPPYYPSVDGARTFLGNIWHQNISQAAMLEESTKHAAAEQRASKSSSLASGSANDSEDDMMIVSSSTTVIVQPTRVLNPQPDYLRAQRRLLDEASKQPRPKQQQRQPQLHNLGIGA